MLPAIYIYTEGLRFILNREKYIKVNLSGLAISAPYLMARDNALSFSGHDTALGIATRCHHHWQGGWPTRSGTILGP